MAKKRVPSGKSKPLTHISENGVPSSSRTRTSSKHESKRKGKEYTAGAHWEQLAALGLKIREVTADGNCFFRWGRVGRAVADQLDGSQASHTMLRKKTVDYIESHGDDFKPFVEDDVSFEEYCESMRQDGTWGGHMELQALSLLMRCNICIHRYQSPRWHIRNFGDPRTRTIHISYHDGEHYNSVRLADDNAWEPALPIVIENDAQLASKPPPQKDNSPYVGDKAGGNVSAIDIVARKTGLSDHASINQALADMGGDVEATTEYLLAAESCLNGREKMNDESEVHETVATETGDGSASPTDTKRKVSKAEQVSLLVGIKQAFLKVKSFRVHVGKKLEDSSSRNLMWG